MALETTFFIYFGLLLLVFGSGFFKPNMTSIISEMYKDFPEKKDGAYTIFYMGVNAGAFFGIMLCGYLGEKVGWSYGFGVAGIFMLFGLLQFWLAKNIFGDIGKIPVKINKSMEVSISDEEGGPENKFTKFQLVLIIISSLMGLTWIFNSPLSKVTEGKYNIFKFELFGIEGNHIIIFTALFLFILLLVIRIPKFIPIVRDKMLAILFFAIITIFFWAIFEQAPGTLNLFAKNYTQRILDGTAGVIFKVVNMLITIVSLAIISWVLIILFKKTFKKYWASNITLSLSFIIIWGIAIWKVNNDFKSKSYILEYYDNNGMLQNTKIVSSKNFLIGDGVSIIDNENISFYDRNLDSNAKNVVRNNMIYNYDGESLGEYFNARIVDFFTVNKKGAGIKINKANLEFVNAKGRRVEKNILLSEDQRSKLKVGSQLGILVQHNISLDENNQKHKRATVKSIDNAVEISATWFNILNSLFIITLAPLFSKLWESKYNPNVNMKYTIGMALLGLGMMSVAIGASDITPGAKTASVSMIWLVLVYLFHTMGELCISPVAFSYISKLVPGRMIAVMFGVWFLAVAIGMKLAGLFGEYSEKVAQESGISTFFWYLTIISFVISLITLLTTPIINKLMHGIK